MFNAFEEGYLCLLKRFSFVSIVDYISFSFYLKYIQKKGYTNFVGTFFWAPIPFKRYQNTSGCSADTCKYFFQHVLKFSFHNLPFKKLEELTDVFHIFFKRYFFINRSLLTSLKNIPVYLVKHKL